MNASNLLTSMSFENWIKKVHDTAARPDEVWGKSLTYLIVSEEDKILTSLPTTESIMKANN